MYKNRSRTHINDWRYCALCAVMLLFTTACSAGVAPPPMPTGAAPSPDMTAVTATEEPATTTNTATVVITPTHAATATPESTPTTDPTATTTTTPTSEATATSEPSPTDEVTATSEASPTDGPMATIESSPTVATTAEATTSAITSTTVALPTESAIAPFDPALAATLQGLLDSTVADRSIPGASLAVHIRGQEPWLGTSGTRDREGQPLAPHTRMRIASISKIFTAVVILQLVDEGLLQLDAPIARWLPGLIPAGDRTTVRHLLNHTTGLYDYLEDHQYRDMAYANSERVWDPRELVAYATRFPLAFEPGAPNRFDYSSTNYVILGMLSNQVTGRSLAQEMRQRIFEPLALESTYFVPDEAVQGTASRGYRADVDQTNISLSFGFATANIVSTPENVARFARGLQDGKLLSAAMMTEMHTFVSGQGQYNMPALEYGLGLMRNQLAVGPGPDGQPRSTETRTVLGHIGGFAGFRSALWTTPDGSITIALGLNQGAAEPNILAAGVFDAILTSQGR